MRIRAYTESDRAALVRLHAAQGFEYAFPDLANPLFLTRLVVEDDSTASDALSFRGRSVAEESQPHVSAPNAPESAAARAGSTGLQPVAFGLPGEPRIVMAALLRLTAEAYLLHDPRAGTPHERWQWMLALHEAARRDAAARGLDDVQAFLPPPIERAFGRRLRRLGWVRDPWTPWCRRTADW